MCKTEVALRLVPFPLPLKNMKFGGPDGISEAGFQQLPVSQLSKFGASP